MEKEKNNKILKSYFIWFVVSVVFLLVFSTLYSLFELEFIALLGGFSVISLFSSCFTSIFVFIQVYKNNRVGVDNNGK